MTTYNLENLPEGVTIEQATQHNQAHTGYVGAIDTWADRQRHSAQVRGRAFWSQARPKLPEYVLKAMQLIKDSTPKNREQKVHHGHRLNPWSDHQRVIDQRNNSR